jgi:hypothetical protein
VLISRSAAQPCTGDCDGAGSVTVDEIIRGVDIALGLLPVGDCESFDRDGNSVVTVDELIIAVDFALQGCLATPTLTASPELMITPTHTPTNSPPAPTPTPAGSQVCVVGGDFRAIVSFDPCTACLCGASAIVTNCDGSPSSTVCGDEVACAVRAAGSCPMSSGCSAAIAASCGATCCATPTSTPSPGPATVQIQGQFHVIPDFFGDGTGERQTVLGDCNNDGLLDVIRGQGSQVKLYVQGPTGTLVASDLGQDLPNGLSFQSGAFADLDGDGNQDLVVADQSVFILRGHGDCAFDAPRAVGLVCPGFPILQTLVTDIDLDGQADLALSCIVGNPTQILLARGDGNYERVSPPPPNSSQNSYPMFGMLFDDIDGDGVRDLLMMVDAEESWFSWGTSSDPLGYVVDEALTNAIVPINPMGAVLLDYDRDGALEYFLSGTETNQLYRYAGERTLVDVADEAGIGHNTDATSYSPYALDVNLDGWTDLLVVRRGGYRPEDEHPVTPYLFINQGGGGFRDAGAQAIDTPLDSGMMSCGDLASDGHISCFVGDVRGTFLLRNEVQPVGNWVGVRLRGMVSSPEASGARVSLDGETPPLVVVTGGQSPVWGEHARDVLLAIGDRSSAAVSVAWPSGIVQRVENLRAGTYTTVIEPKALAISARVAPADGQSLVDVTVDLDAAHAASASIEREGAGTWTGVATASGGTLHRQLRAPVNPGSARIDVQLDGVGLRVRPRVRFEKNQ